MGFVRSIVFSFALFFSISIPAFSQNSIDHSVWDKLLKDCTAGGLADYGCFTRNQPLLEGYLQSLESFPLDSFSTMSREERLAFWINLHNASVIRMIVDEYPVESVENIPAFFEVRKIQAIGEFFNLLELRNAVLRKGFPDERILTVLVSGRMDSPGFMAEAFTGRQLEEQLSRGASLFVSDSERNQITPGGKKIFLSPIFKKFASDFLVNFSASGDTPFSETESAVISFILHHLKDPDRRIYLDSAKYKIKYLPEDPRLNAVSISKTHDSIQS